MALSEIVTTATQAGTVNPARRGFGVPLFLGYHTAWTTDEVRSYSTFSAVAADFDAHEMPYLWAAAIFAQRPRPPVIKIGRLPAPPSAYTATLNFAAMASSVTIEGTIVLPDGTTTAISIPWDTDLATTLGDLKTFLDALTGVGTCTVSSPVVTVPATSNGPMFHFSFTTPGVKVRDSTTDWDYDDRLDDLLEIDPDFYGVFTDVNSPRNMDKIARWALANDRLAFFGPQYTDPAQFVSGEFAAGADYTALLANDAAVGLFTQADRRSFPEAAWAGRMFALAPGSATYAYKTLTGVGADTWTLSQRTVIAATNHGNHYATEAAVGITRPGKTFGGEWIDVVTGLAWVEAQIQERIFALLVNSPKIPYTDDGLALLVAEVRGVLQDAEARSIFDAGWEVTILAVSDQETADRAARIARGLEWSSRLAGAVHTVNVIGTVTV